MLKKCHESKKFCFQDKNEWFQHKQNNIYCNKSDFRSFYIIGAKNIMRN